VPNIGYIRGKGDGQSEIYMKALNMKLAFAAVAVAVLASPAFAARMHQQAQEQDYVTNDGFQRGQFYTYPNGATKSGSAQNVESGAEFNLLEHPVD
jgi:hypothetical protein